MAVEKKMMFPTLKHLSGLRPATQKSLQAANISAEELIDVARNDAVYRTYAPHCANSPEANRLRQIPSVGEVRAKEIARAVDKAGLILHDKKRSRQTRQLAVAVSGSPSLLLEHYEELESMAPEALEAVDQLVHWALPERELHVIEWRFYPKDGRRRTLQECAEAFGITRERARQLETSALSRLRCPKNRAKLEVATCYSREALARRMAELWTGIDKLQSELKMLQQGSPYPEFKDPETGGMPIGELDLSVRAYKCLERAGITTVGELCKYTENDLLNIRNFGTKQVEEVVKFLQGMGLSLAS